MNWKSWREDGCPAIAQKPLRRDRENAGRVDQLCVKRRFRICGKIVADA
ncbi:hypothetical protein NKH47_16935 [Mesorhizobium sp. M1060]|nr:hypothetical protein [Mesorhizobium sp. L2C066B000]